MFLPLDGPSKQGVLTITDSVVTEVKVGGSAFEERKVITMQPKGKILVYFGDDGIAPSVATIVSDGFTQQKDTTRTYEATNTQAVYIISDTGANVDVVVAERA